jgi:hypothetical protein
VKAFVVPVAAVVLVLGCQQHGDRENGMPKSSGQPASAQQPAEAPRVLGLEPGWELATDADYSASQTPGDEVTLRATGEHPTAGYETKFVMSPMRIYPPQWMLAVKKPTGPAAQVVTPFDVSTSFKANDHIRTLRVTDAAGTHDVKVESAD